MYVKGLKEVGLRKTWKNQ